MAVCSECSAKIVDGGAPYRESRVHNVPAAPRIRRPLITSERLKKVASYTLAVVLEVAALVACAIYAPKFVVGFGVGMLTLAALFIAAFAVFCVAFVFPHRVGVVVVRKFGWKKLFKNEDIDDDYDAMEGGPVAWFMGVISLCGIPALYYIGRAAMVVLHFNM